MKIDFNKNQNKLKKTSLSRSTNKKGYNKKDNQLSTHFSILNPKLRHEYMNYLSKIPNGIVDDYTSLHSNKGYPILKDKKTKQSFDSDIELLLSTSNETINREINENKIPLLKGKILNNTNSYLDQKASSNRKNHENSESTLEFTVTSNNYNQKVPNNLKCEPLNINSINNFCECNMLYNTKINNENSKVCNHCVNNTKFEGKNLNDSEFQSKKKIQPSIVEISDNSKNLSHENTLQNNFTKQNEFQDSIKGIFNTPNIPNPLKIEEKDFNILKILEDKESVLKDALYNIPNYFFTLRNEYINTKNILEKLQFDLCEKSKINEELVNKLNCLIKESNEKSEKLLKLVNENESLKNKQKVLELFKEETKGYLEILKKDNEDKTSEIEKISKSNSEYKIEKARTMFSIDLLNREKNELMRNFTHLEQEKEVIREELKCLKEFTESTLEKILKNGVFEKIRVLENERKEMALYKYFYSNCSVNMKYIESNFQTLKLELDSAVNQFIKILKDKEEEIKVLKKENVEIKAVNKQINSFLNKIKKENGDLDRTLAEAKTQILKIEEFTRQDKIKRQLIETINGQKMELETQRDFYERQIRELTEKLEEQIDIWDVFE